MKIGRVAKAVVTAVGTVITVLVAAVGDDVLSMDETAQLVSTLVTGAVTVYAAWRVPNTPEA